MKNKEIVTKFGFLMDTEENTLEAVFTALDNAVLLSITNPEGIITYANDKFVEVSKYSREELLGENHKMLKSGCHTTSFYQELWRTISSGKVWRGEIKDKAKDGTFYWLDANISPIFDDFGKIQGYIAIRFLITDKKEMEEKLKDELGKRNHVKK